MSASRTMSRKWSRSMPAASLAASWRLSEKMTSFRAGLFWKRRGISRTVALARDLAGFLKPGAVIAKRRAEVRVATSGGNRRRSADTSLASAAHQSDSRR